MFNQIQCSILWKFPSSVKYIHSCGLCLSNHYETLKVPRNCTTKDIKESFIKLSKENHPDLNKNKSAHAEFVKIKEAYNVLSKPNLRRSYDMRIKYNDSQDSPHPGERYGHNPWNDPAFYNNRDKSKDGYHEGRPYYGIDGLDRVPNHLVAFLCVMLATIIVGIQVFTIRHSITFKREELDRRSNEAEHTLKQIRETAEINGNKLQIELLKAKIAQGDR